MWRSRQEPNICRKEGLVSLTIAIFITPPSSRSPLHPLLRWHLNCSVRVGRQKLSPRRVGTRTPSSLGSAQRPHKIIRRLQLLPGLGTRELLLPPPFLLYSRNRKSLSSISPPLRLGSFTTSDLLLAVRLGIDNILPLVPFHCRVSPVD